MAQLILSQTEHLSQPEHYYLIRKRMTTVGWDPNYDVFVGPASGQRESSGLIFTINQSANHPINQPINHNDENFEIIPSKIKIRLNGQSVHRTTSIHSCDRIEWAGGVAVFVSSDHLKAPSAQDPAQAMRSLRILQNLASTLRSPDSIPSALVQALDALVELAGAETGYLLSEVGAESSWELIASRHQTESSQNQPKPNRREFLSNTILHRAIEKREPIYMENVVGHPWADAASIIEARIFSAACFPLCVGDHVFGAVFLLTRSPGKSIRKESLSELSLLATQAALMLASKIELKSVRNENAILRGLISKTTSSLVFKRDSASPNPMLEVERRIQKLANAPLSVLIRGETGTGKELAAREIHQKSNRSKAPFIAVNCAAIPSPLLESTLFGYERGAFTGADKNQAGKFVQATGGTLFLDEIGDLPFELQAKLLRVLQEKSVEPLGSTRAISVDVRILSATHQDIETAVSEGKFRQDLYFRLAGTTLQLPPLRDRREDIRFLADYFIQRAGSQLFFSPEAIRALEAHGWSGNVRELEQVITRALFLCEGEKITEEDLELQLFDFPNSNSNATFGKLSEFSNLQEAQLAFTQDYVQKILQRHSGNRAEAAASLGVSERTLYRILANDNPVRPL